MAMGERTWEVLVLLTLSCAAVLMMFVGVSSWSDMNQPIQVSSQSQRPVVDMPPWIYRDFVIHEARDVEDGGVLSKARSYFDGFGDLIGSQLGNPFSLWSGEENKPGQELDIGHHPILSGVVASVKSFFAGIGDSVKSWGQTSISPPAILHATEPLDRVPYSGMAPTATLASKLTAILGKVLEAYYADNVAAEHGKTCSGILEEETRKLVKNLKHKLKAKLCSGELKSANEEKFCNFYSIHPKAATLMVFTKMEVDPIGVALMRVSTSDLCAASNGNLVHSLHRMEKLARWLRMNLPEGVQDGFAGHEHEEKYQEHDGLRKSHFDAEEGQSCKEADCYRQESLIFLKNIKSRLFSVCQAPSSCMEETCAFVKEHRYLAKTYLVLKIRPWEIVATACAVSCRSSPGSIFPLGILRYPRMAVSQPHAPNHPGFGHGFIRRLDMQHPGLVRADPDMPVLHNPAITRSSLRHNSRYLRLARLQAFRRAMQLRGNILGSSDSEGDRGMEGNGQAHLVIVVNGHPFGSSNINDLFANLRSLTNTPRVTTGTSSQSNPRPIPLVLLEPFYGKWQSTSAWKNTESTYEKIEFQGHTEHQAVDSYVGGNPDVESLDQVSVKSDEKEETIPYEGNSTEVAASSVEESDGSTMGFSIERAPEDSYGSDLGESTTSSEESSSEGSRAAM